MKKLILLFSLFPTSCFSWTVGDVVYLKSCSPTMTVTSQQPDNSVGVHWFAGQTMLAATFPADTLTTYFPCPALAHAEKIIAGTDNPPDPVAPEALSVPAVPVK